MYKRNIVIKSIDEINQQLEIFHSDLKLANLPEQSSRLLKDQVETALFQLERQLASIPVHTINADRLFEGDEYKVTIRMRVGVSLGPFSAVKRVLGFG